MKKIFEWIKRIAALMDHGRAAVFTRGSGTKILLIDQRYPYERRKVYQNTSLWTVAGGLWASGFDVEVLDFNIESVRSRRSRKLIKSANLFGLSPTGGPNAADLVNICKKLSRVRPDAKILVGGQWVEGMEEWEFDILMAGTNAVLFKDLPDLKKADIDPASIDNLFHHPMGEILDRHPRHRDAYLRAAERALVLSRGCNKGCDFCGALNGVPEKFKPIAAFYFDLLHQVRRAKELGLAELEYYSTSLDFFQNPQTLALYLECIGDVSEAQNFEIKVRALSCMNSFIHAAKVVPNLQELCKRAGVWNIGFGIDGIKKEVWRSLGKSHNHLEDVKTVAELTGEWGVRMEILMFVGDPSASTELVDETFEFTTHLLDTYPHSVCRIHVAKTLTGSRWWKVMPLATKLSYLVDPSLFYNVDVLACASKLSHPEKEMRRKVNSAYLSFLWKERRAGRCVSSTIFPQGGPGLLPQLAKVANRFMPFDR